MRSLVLLLACLLSLSLFSQSKKELQTQINQLKTENAQLKSDNTKLQGENDELKKPKTVALDNVHTKASYGLGVLMASNVKKQGGDSLDLGALTVGMEDVFKKGPLKMDEKEATMVVQEYMQKTMEQRMSKSKGESAAFLEENKKKPGVVTTASGLQYQIIKKGTGVAPSASSSVTVHYTGRLVDGTIFDTSMDGEPATFNVNQVIAGWTQALQLMHEGDKWMLFIPSDLAYGDRGAGGQIPPFAALVFEVELLKVNPSPNK